MESIEDLKDYRARMDVPMEELGSAIQPHDSSRYSDAEIVEVAVKKLKTMRTILLTYMSEGIVDAIMRE